MDQLMELRPHQFAQVPNEAVDTLPDLNSIGLLTTMLRHAPGYRFTVADVITKKRKIPGPRLGKDAAYGAMDTLLDHRWTCRVRFMCAKGHWNTGMFRTSVRFTDDDFREVCRRFTAGTPMLIHCQGCSDKPEIPVHTTVRRGAKLTWDESRKAGLKYGHPIKELMAPGGLLSLTPAPESGIPEVGPNSEDTTSSQVSPDSGFPEVGEPTVGDPEVFYKTGGEHSSSSSDPDTPPSPEGLVEEDEEKPSAPKPRTGAPSSSVVLIQERTGATVEEAQAVITRLRQEKKRTTGEDIRVMRRYVIKFEPEDLTPHLDAVRAQRASEARTQAPEGPDATCGEHQGQSVPCPVCLTLQPVMAKQLLARFGPVRRPDLAERVQGHAPTPA